MLSLPAHALLWLLAAPPEAVQWRAPPECPDRDALLRAIARRLGRPLADAEITIDAAVAGDPRRGYTLQLALTAGARGETREVHDVSCAALTDAAALRVVAVLESAPLLPASPPPVLPAADPASPTTTAASLPVVTTEPAASDLALPEPAPPPVPRDSFVPPGAALRLHGGGELGAVPGSTGSAPGPTGAVGLGLGLLWPRLRLELQATVLAPRTASVGSGSVRAGLYAGSVHACGRVGRGALELPLCAGLELGAMVARASGLPSARAATAWWAAAVLGPGLAWHVGRRFTLWASLQLVLAPVRPRFEQQTGAAAATIFKPSVASGRLLLGVELRLRDPW